MCVCVCGLICVLFLMCCVLLHVFVLLFVFVCVRVCVCVKVSVRFVCDLTCNAALLVFVVLNVLCVFVCGC